MLIVEMEGLGDLFSPCLFTDWQWLLIVWYCVAYTCDVTHLQSSAVSTITWLCVINVLQPCVEVMVCVVVLCVGLIDLVKSIIMPCHALSRSGAVHLKVTDFGVILVTNGTVTLDALWGTCDISLLYFISLSFSFSSSVSPHLCYFDWLLNVASLVLGHPFFSQYVRHPGIPADEQVCLDAKWLSCFLSQITRISHMLCNCVKLCM